MSSFQAIEDDAKKLALEARGSGAGKEELRVLLFLLAPLSPLELKRVLIHLEDGLKVYVVDDRAERTAAEISGGKLAKHAQAIIKATLKAAEEAARTYLVVTAASL